MLPLASPAKAAQKERGKVASSESKGKVKGLAKAKTGSKKSDVHLAKKAENTSKTSKNNGKSNAKPKGKSKTSSRSLVVSEAQ